MNNRILIHAPNLSTPGGKQSYFTAIKDRFHSQVTFFFYGAQGKKESKLKTISRMWKDYRRFYKLLKSGEYNVVHLNPSLNPKSFWRDSIFALICSWLKVKTVVFWHGWRWDFEKKVVQKILPWFKWTYGKADAMIILGTEFKKRLRTYGYEKPVFLETTVVDDLIFNYNGGHRPNGGYADNKPVTLLFLSRVEKAKGIYETVDSFAKLKAMYANVVLNIAGTGSELDNLKTYIDENNIEGVNFLGWMAGEAKAQAFYEADIYILASYTEGMPCSLLEAMASGLSIVTTDVGGIKDFFEPEKMGYFVQVKNRSDLEEKLGMLLENPERIAESGYYNANFARQRFSPDQVANRLETIYEEIQN